MIKKISFVFILIILLTGLGVLGFYVTSYRPADVEEVSFVSPKAAPLLKPDQTIKVLNWNIQYMAGKNYVFYYDLLDGSGPDIRPSAADIKKTTQRVAEIIIDEDPDIILLQELDINAKKTDYQNQLEELLKLLPSEYNSYAFAYYWKAPFIPHPKIKGRVGMVLAVISKYQISKAIRLQLPIMPDNFFIKMFQFKRAVLDVALPYSNGHSLAIMNTHLDAFAQGNDTMQKQVEMIDKLLTDKNEQKIQWIIGGDFNLLPSTNAYYQLAESERRYYQEKSEIEVLTEKFQIIPDSKDIQGKNCQKWFTHFPNSFIIKKPDRTIDYLLYSDILVRKKAYVRHNDTFDISDHLPIIGVFQSKG
ncbi:MAG: endonuclease/exonuclease/phosphatase family protein [Spirochaetes bacterium]|nr:endonuclease/exonuclease/phosphatase family protein [Spirochaetota bacterium]